MTRIQIAIIKTLVYTHIFDYPLKIDELWRFLISCPTTYAKFHQNLTNLIDQKAVSCYNRYYYLAGQKKLVRFRHKRHKIAVGKQAWAGHIAQILGKIPWVWLVSISGSLAWENSSPEDDIDLFIITAPGSLWTGRLIVTSLLTILGVRRKPQHINIKDKICLNMFMDAKRLQLPRIDHDLYTAYEIVQMKPLVNKRHTWQKFLSANVWVKHFLPHALSKVSYAIKDETNISSGVNMFESWCRKLQLWYMSHRRTNEVIDENILRFHPVDTRIWVKYRYRADLQNLGLTK